jgi:phosphoglycolate phosphatase-like HAD superfamily hydrolase
MVENRDTCLSCARLLECSATPETCKKYEYAELDKAAITTRYLKAVKKLNEAIAELKQAEVGLGILEKMAD